MDDSSLFRAAYELLLPWGPLQMLRLVHSGGLGETPIIRNIAACTRKHSSEDGRYFVLVFAGPEPAAAFASILAGTASTASWVLPPKEDIAADVAAGEGVNTLSGNELSVPVDSDVPLRGFSCSIPRPETLSLEALNDALETFRSFGIAASHLTVAADHVAKASRSDSSVSVKRQHTTDDPEASPLVMKVERKHPGHRDRTSSSGSGLAIPMSECDAFRRKVARSGGSDIVHEREPDSKWTNLRANPVLATSELESSRNGISVTITRTPPRHVKASSISDARIRASSEGTGLLVTSIDETSPALSSGGKARWSVIPRRNSGTGSPVLPESTPQHSSELKLSIAKGPTPDGSRGFARRRTSTASGCEIKSPGAFVA
jgi:hypothetical protein